jgi:hypothetical protein
VLHSGIKPLHRPTRLRLLPRTPTSNTRATVKFVPLDPFPSYPSAPTSPLGTLPPITHPSTPPNPLNRRDFTFFPNSGQDRRRGTLHVDTLLRSVSRLTSGRFKFLSFPRCSCARPCSLDVNRSTGTTSPRLERPPDDTVSVASDLGYLLEPRNVSTTFSDLRGSSLARSIALY